MQFSHLLTFVFHYEELKILLHILWELICKNTKTMLFTTFLVQDMHI